MEFSHVSVLLNETIEQLHIRPDGIYVDGTLGGGGHSYEICRRLSEKGRLVGIDQDADAIEAAGKAPGGIPGPRDDCPQQLLRYAPGAPEAWHREGGWDCPGSGRLLLPAGRGGAGLHLPGGRAPGYAHGSAPDEDCEGYRERLFGGGSLPSESATWEKRGSREISRNTLWRRERRNRSRRRGS